MANDACGICKVVAKNKLTLERLKKIMNYKDDEFYPSRCRQFDPCGDAFEDNGFWVQDFNVDGCWNCCRFFETPEDRKLLKVIGYEKDENGRDDWDKPIYGTAHLTNLVELAKLLDFGCELFDTEPGIGFCEHLSVNHNGDYDKEEGAYSIDYPLDENGESDYDQEPTENIGLENFMEFGWASEIYGV